MGEMMARAKVPDYGFEGVMATAEDLKEKGIA